MTPSQMLAKLPANSIKDAVSSPRPAPVLRFHDHPPADHVIKVLEPPALKSVRVKRSSGEAWLIEQLELGNCPVCQEHLLHMRSIKAPDIDFYTCEADPTEHRWTLIDDR